MHVIFTLLFVVTSFLPLPLIGNAHSELGPGADPSVSSLEDDGDLGPSVDPGG